MIPQNVLWALHSQIESIVNTIVLLGYDKIDDELIFNYDLADVTVKFKTKQDIVDYCRENSNIYFIIFR